MSAQEVLELYRRALDHYARTLRAAAVNRRGAGRDFLMQDVGEVESETMLVINLMSNADDIRFREVVRDHAQTLIAAFDAYATDLEDTKKSFIEVTGRKDVRDSTKSWQGQNAAKAM